MRNQGLSNKYYILMRKLRVLHGEIYRAYSTKKNLWSGTRANP